MVVVKTVRSVTTRVRFLRVILTSLGSKSGTPFYLICLKRVNTILNPPGRESALAQAMPGTSGHDRQLLGERGRAASDRRFLQPNYLHR